MLLIQGIAEICWLCLQHEISQKALEVLQSTPDARGRAIQVVKVPTPPPMFITEAEEAGMKVRQLLSAWPHAAENAPANPYC